MMPNLLYTTVVYPKEYDLDEQVKQAIDISNKQQDCYILIDVGKLVGLYNAYSDVTKSHTKPRETKKKSKFSRWILNRVFLN